LLVYLAEVNLSRFENSLSLIKRSAKLIVQLQQQSKEAGQNNIVVVPQPGCGLGRLDYSTQVKPLLENILIGSQFLTIANKR
jgi:hypothetical protein